MSTFSRLACLRTFTRLGVLALVPSAAAAQTVQLSGPLARPIGGDIQSFQVDRSGTRVVYLADQEQDDVFELFSVRPGTRPIRLNPPLPNGRDVESFQLSSDGARVVYRARLEARPELFSVSSKGGASVRLNGPLATGVASWFQIDAMSRHVAFAADYHLFVAPIDGSAPAVQLTTIAMPSFRLAGARIFFQEMQGGVSSFFSANLDGSGVPTQITPPFPGRFLFEVTADGSRALYVDLDSRGELFSVPGEGGAPTQLSVPGRLRERLTSFLLSPDGRRVVYDKAGLHSVSVLGGETPIPLQANSLDFRFDADGTHVVYRGRRGGGDGLFSVPILGGAAPEPIAGPGRFDQWWIAAGERVVYAQDVSVPGAIEFDLESVPVAGGEPPVPLASVFWGGYLLDFSVVGENVLYRSQTNPSTIELFSVPADGSRAPRRIDRPLVAERAVQPGYATSSDGRRVVYLADRDADGVFELFLAPSDGSRPAMKLNPPLPVGPVEGDVSQARFGPDGTRAVFIADAHENDVFELFSVSSAGDEAPLQLNEPLAPGGDVTQFEFASDLVVYMADQDVNDEMHVYSVPIGGGTPIRLDDAASVRFFELTPDRSRIVYRTDENRDGFHELNVAPVTGGFPPIQLETSAPSDWPSQQVSPASDRLIYVGDRDRDGQVDLFSVPLAGGSPVRLSDPTPAGRIVLGFAITADSQRVVYLMRVGYYVQSLFSVPIDGSTSPIRLDAALSAEPTVRGFVLSPDGTSVVFSSDALEEGIYELFRMPVDASTGPVRLHTANADSPEITPDGTRAIYLVQTAPGAYELHVVRLDASAPPIVLSPARRYLFSPNKPIRITPDSARVVFLSAPSHGGQELHVVPLDGSHAPIRLSRPRTELSVHDFRLTPDGRTAVYRFGEEYSNRGELFRVPIDGPRLPVRISRLSTLSGSDISPDGTRVLHRSTRDDPGIVELFASELADRPRAVAPR